MSLSRVALRIAAVEALKGRTLVGPNVIDSPNGAIDIHADGSFRTAKEKPFIGIFTPSTVAADVTGRSLVENGDCEIVFQMGVSTAMVKRDPQTKASVLEGVNIPASDRGRAFYIDVVEREIRSALNDPANAWAEIFRKLHYSVRRVEVADFQSVDDQRLTARELRITVELMDDPLVGDPLLDGSVYADFLSALEASDDDLYQRHAATLRALLAGDHGPADGLQRLHGMTADELMAIGLAPFAETEPVDFDKASLVVNGETREVLP